MSRPTSSYPRLTESVNHPLLEGITDKRLALFLDGHYASQNLSSVLEWDRVSGPDHVRMIVWSAPGSSKPSFDQAASQFWARSESDQRVSRESGSIRPYEIGTSLGPSFTNHWVHAKMTIPSEWKESGEPVIFHFDPMCEGLLFTPDGKALHGITGGRDSNKDGVPGASSDRRVDHLVPREAVERGEYELVIELSCNGMFGTGLNGYRHQQPDPNVYFALEAAQLVHQNSEAAALELDFIILRQIATFPDRATSSLSKRALRACNDIMNAFGSSDHCSDRNEVKALIRRCRELAFRILGRLDAEGRGRICTIDPTSGGEEAKLWAIGHCHIDTAWLWTYSVTQQKVARSWSTQIDLMERYPGHKFGASSPQQYAWLEELYPELFARLKEKVRAGSFVPLGMAWIEHDCILPSGESLCRQYLMGHRYFASRFDGYRCREAWLPDTFGYASQLPQILRLCGLDYFFTQKLSWNNITEFPYSTFNWASLDGSQVLAHMTPVNSYNSQCHYDELINGIGKNKNLGVTDDCLLLFGNGDGGGGPTPKMLEKLGRISSLGLANPEVPKTRVAAPGDFFDHVKAKTNNGKELPVWKGELYFELHRGTYTSQAKIKSGNRCLEKALRDVEYYGTVASIANKDYRYPKKQVDAAWFDTLLGQFHDVLPGTSIRQAMVDTHIMVDRQLEILDGLIHQALAAAVPASAARNEHRDAPPTGHRIIGIDPVRLPRNQVVQASASLGPFLANSRSQATDAGPLVLMATDEDGICHVAAVDPSSAPKAYQSGNDHVLENGHFKVTISGGRITSLIDVLLERELILPGSSAVDGGLMIYDDFPLAYDAWDAEIFHLDCVHVINFDEVEVVANGPLRASLRATARFGKSMVAMTFSLDVITDNQPGTRSWIRVDTVADWHEKHKFLKFVLPVDIHAPNATYDTQFGLIERPTHRNTKRDQAMFEVVAHRFGDLSEAGYGVALVTDCKYGYAVEGNVMRLSLLRSATAPDPIQDMGKHEFYFGIMPHIGRLQESTVPKDALRFTNPIKLLALPDGAPNHLATTRFEISGPLSKGITLDTIKRGEDDDFEGATGEKVVILRMFEGLGGRSRGKLRIAGIQAESVTFVNILEEPMAAFEGKPVWRKTSSGTEIDLSLRGFEIQTFKVVVAL